MSRNLVVHFEVPQGDLSSFKLSTDWRLNDQELNSLRAMERELENHQIGDRSLVWSV